jgi:hypothetical protein
MQCEHCNNDVAYNDAHSMIIVLQKCTTYGYSWMQCERGNLVDGHNFQHWHCGIDHMQASVKRCISEHYSEDALISVPVTQVRLHRQVLAACLICKICQERIIDTAYRFALTVATPFNWIPDDSQDVLGGWCCSLDHARQHAHLAIDSIK